MTVDKGIKDGSKGTYLPGPGGEAYRELENKGLAADRVGQGTFLQATRGHGPPASRVKWRWLDWQERTVNGAADHLLPRRGVAVAALSVTIVAGLSLYFACLYQDDFRVYLAGAHDLAGGALYSRQTRGEFFTYPPFAALVWVPNGNLRPLHENSWQLLVGNSFFVWMMVFLGAIAASALWRTPTTARTGEKPRPARPGTCQPQTVRLAVTHSHGQHGQAPVHSELPNWRRGPKPRCPPSHIKHAPSPPPPHRRSDADRYRCAS
jgi:hypothetical protein